MRLRFTIRDLLWLTALVAMALAWWLDHRQLTKPQRYRVETPADGSWSALLDNQSMEIWMRNGNLWVPLPTPHRGDGRPYTEKKREVLNQQWEKLQHFDKLTLPPKDE